MSIAMIKTTSGQTCSPKPDKHAAAALLLEKATLHELSLMDCPAAYNGGWRE